MGADRDGSDDSGESGEVGLAFGLALLALFELGLRPAADGVEGTCRACAAWRVACACACARSRATTALALMRSVVLLALTVSEDEDDAEESGVRWGSGCCRNGALRGLPPAISAVIVGVGNAAMVSAGRDTEWQIECARERREWNRTEEENGRREKRKEEEREREGRRESSGLKRRSF